MKLLLYADNHFSKYSSILRNRGEKYSKRLENQIDCLNWVESIAVEKHCDAVICLGDFFDSSSLDAEEISALQEIKWNPAVSRVFLVGNHELGVDVNNYNTANLFNLIDGSTVVSKPYTFVDGKTRICFLPYIVESQREDLEKYLFVGDKSYEKTIILSHNDILGAQYGAYVSKSGFSIEEIEKNCDLMINGHIHNSGYVSKKIFNLGNLTGQNFNEDGSLYPHRVAILDTDTLEMVLIQNPFAIKFKKLDFVGEYDLCKIEHYLLAASNGEFVLSVTCDENNQQFIKDKLSGMNNLINFRIIIERTTKEINEPQISHETFNHIDKFVEYIHETVGVSKLIDDELGEVVR